MNAWGDPPLTEPIEPATDAPLSAPFPGRPSAALRAGYCPSCMGTGRVERLTRVEPFITDVASTCSTCAGTGTWPPS